MVTGDSVCEYWAGWKFSLKQSVQPLFLSLESLNMHRKLFDEVVGAKCGRKYQVALYRWTIDVEDMLQNRERFS